jgi:hypothetical protein
MYFGISIAVVIAVITLFSKFVVSPHHKIQKEKDENAKE